MDSVPEWISVIITVGTLLVSVGFVVAQLKQLAIAIDHLSQSIHDLRKDQQHTRERVIAIETQLKNEQRVRT